MIKEWKLNKLSTVYISVIFWFWLNKQAKTKKEKIFNVIYSDKLETFLQEQSQYIEEFYYKDEGFNLPDRGSVKSVSVKMNDPEDIASGLKDAISKLSE